MSETKDLRLRPPPSPKAKARFLPIARDPSLPLVDLDDTPTWEHRPRRERSLMPPPTSHRPVL